MSRAENKQQAGGGAASEEEKRQAGEEMDKMQTLAALTRSSSPDRDL